MTRVLIVHQPDARRRAGSIETSILSAVRDVEAALCARGHVAAKATVTRDFASLHNAIRKHRPAVIFNLCERIKNDPRLEKNAIALFEIVGVPFTGNGSLALGLCQRKSLAKLLLRSAKIPTPPYVVIDDPDTELQFKLPAIVKPVWEDGSSGITMRSVVKSQKALRGRVRYVLRRFRQPALVEAFVSGREFQVSLLGNRTPRILAIAQLSYRGLPRRLPRICAYAAKWDPGSNYYSFTNPLVPATIPRALEARIEQLARDVFRLFELRGYARIDIRERGGRPYVIDVNPNPDISADAGFARAAAAAELPYADLIDRVVELAQEG